MNSTDVCNVLHSCTFVTPQPKFAHGYYVWLDVVGWACWTAAYIMWTIASHRQKRYVGVPFEALTYNCLSEAIFGFIDIKHISFHQAIFNTIWFIFDVYQFYTYFHYDILPSVKILFSKNADSRKKSEALGVVTYFVMVIYFVLGLIMSWVIGWGDKTGEFTSYWDQDIMSALFLRRLVMNPSTGADTFAVVIPGILKFIGTIVASISDYDRYNYNAFFFWMVFCTTFMDVTYIAFSIVFNKIYSDDTEKPAINKEREQLKNEGDCEYVPLAQ